MTLLTPLLSAGITSVHYHAQEEFSVYLLLTDPVYM